MEEKRELYISVPTLIGTGITLLMLLSVGNIGLFFLMIAIHTIYTIVCFKVVSLEDHAVLVLIGAIAGTIGSFWCGSYIKFGSQYGKDSSGYLVWFIILLLIPHVVHLFLALSRNSEIVARERQLAAERRERERRNEEYRRETERREKEQWEKDIGSQIDNLFS